jgi:transcriptional regulator with XRE-family HTH domain
MRERLLKFLLTEKISASKFADEIGVQRSGVSHILSGRNNPGFEFIQKILERYKYLNAEWLIMGTGNMLKDIKQTTLFKEEVVIPVNAKAEKLIIKKTSDDNLPESNTRKQKAEDTELNRLKEDIINSPIDRKIARVLVFFSDKTFSEYLPEN